MDWKVLIVGVVLIVILGVGGLLYRNVVERTDNPIACPMDAKVCPDGTSVGREGLSCTFPACPPPNASLDELGIAFAIPSGFTEVVPRESAVIKQYDGPGIEATSTEWTLASAELTVRRFPIQASSTALATIESTAIGDGSGLPISPSRYTSTTIADRQYTVVQIGRFEGVVQTAYYLAREARGDVLRFDAVDRGVDWTNSALDTASLPAHAALVNLLETVQGT